jgi:hypothetical protein
VTIDLQNCIIANNRSEHRDDEQKAEMVIRGVTAFKLAGESITPHPANKFLYSLFGVKSKDVSLSTTFVTGKAAGTVLEK